MTAPSSSLLLFAAADPGGANAVLPVVDTLAARGRNVAIVDHGFLGRNALAGWHRLVPPDGESLEDWLRRYGAGGLCFGTSLADHLPLALARGARRSGLPVACVLDNWMNYRARLEMDGGGLLVPDLYAVMDAKAHDEAVADGVPESCLKISGHPGLAGLAHEIAAADGTWCQAVRERLGLGLDGRQLLVFVGEPVAHDQGTGPETPGWRGYTERDVLPLLCRALQPVAENLDLAILPHPRDDLEALDVLWTTSRGRLAGKVLRGASGRQVVLAADRVAGMASILLYEAWLQGKPALSLQPGLVRPDLAAAVTRDGLVLVTERAGVDAAVGRWLAEAGGLVRPDCRMHGEAPARLADLLDEMMRKKGGWGE